MPEAPSKTSKTNKTAAVAAVSGSALALMIAFTAPREGEVRHTYLDKVGKHGAVLTYCYGATKGAKLGQTYTHEECLASLKDQALAHAQEVQSCLPAGLPDETAAAFYDLGYNIGASGFCRSSIPRLAKAGDLKASCNKIGAFVYSNGKDCRDRSNKCYGIAKRRQDEVSLCLKGLSK